jgi:hypothetical protein
MSEYRPRTERGQEMLDLGVSEDTVQVFEGLLQHKLQTDATVALVGKHPEVAQREVQEAMGQVVARDPQKFERVAMADPLAAMEMALYESHALPAASQPQGGDRGSLVGRFAGLSPLDARGVYDPGISLLDRHRLTEQARESKRIFGDDQQALRSVIGPPTRALHPGLDDPTWEPPR